MALAQRTRARLGAMLVGAGVTAACCGLFAAGFLTRLDDAGLDLHFRHFSSIPADARIVLIDIDDSSLAAIGEWPWPRRRHAEIVRTLHELEAKRIVYDIVFAEPTPPRIVDAPSSSAHSPAETQGVSTPFIHDDEELSDAIGAAGNVYLATFAHVSPPEADPPSAREEVSAAGEHVGPHAARLVARRRATELLHADPAATSATLRKSMLPDGTSASSTPAHTTLDAAFRWATAVRRIEAHRPTVPPSVDAALPRVYDLTPPLFELVSAARAVGVVQFEREASGGVFREVPLLVNSNGKLLPQLGFAAAMDEVGLDWSAMELRGQVLDIGAGETRVPVPIDQNGSTLINWHAPDDSRWESSFVHIPAARVLEVADLRRAIETNADFLVARTIELVHARHVDTPADYVGYEGRLNRRHEITESLRRNKSRDPSELAAELRTIDEQVRAVEEEALTWLAHAWRTWENEQPRDATEESERQHIADLYEDFGARELEQELRNTNVALAERIEELLAELRPAVRDKLCFIGYTASTVADFVTSPVHPSMPGVMAHANIANMFLRNRFVARAPMAWRLGLIAAAGLLVTFLACAGGWRFGLLGFVLTLSGLALTGWWLFMGEGLYISSPVAAGAAAAAWSAVTVFLQGTEERSRRRLQNALTQYTSPAIAARIAERLDDENLSPRTAEVTCFFADLRNFTALSERLGPARTRDLLNPYLEAVSNVLVAEGALVNKFMGDGVFAFFNAPVRPCADHARAACAAALRTIHAVDRLSGPTSDRRTPASNRDSSTAARENAVPASLIARVGLATGEAFVGDYGSKVKLDYTCIGDTVNVGSRLEEANKFFGTRILANAATREAAGDEFLFRYLGRVLLIGKVSAVETYELMGRSAEIGGPVASFVAEFEGVVRAYQHREFAQCVQMLERCRLVRPHDNVVRRYAVELAAARARDTADAWAGSIRAFE